MKCRICGIEDSKFMRRRYKGKFRYYNLCISCHREYFKLWYEKNKEYSKKRVELWKKQNPKKSTEINKRKWKKKKRKRYQTEEYHYIGE